MSKKIQALLLVATLTATSLLMSSCAHKHRFGEDKYSESTCLSEGYKYHLCNSCGFLERWDNEPAKGHTFTNWKNDMRLLKRVAKCDLCGLNTEDNNYVDPTSIPRLYVYGNPNGEVVPVQYRYETTIESTFYGAVKLDANESNAYYKKDYDMLITTDITNKTPTKLTFTESMGSYDSFALKSEYADKTSIRNLAASELWYNVIKTRDHIPTQLRELPYLGADFGFPVIFYTNDNFKGIYNICLPNDGKLFGLTNDRSALIYTYTDFGTFDFRYSAGGDNHVPCTVVYPENAEGALYAQNNFTKFIEYVNNASTETFRESADDHLDLDAAIDYLICVYLFGADDNIAEFCNWVTYDGKIYIPSMYNLTHSFGIDSTGYLREAEGTLAPNIENGVLMSGTVFPLWEKLCAAFPERISERYSFLRNTVLTNDNVQKVFEKHINTIAPEVYEAEFEEYNDKTLCNGPDTAEEIADWYSKKCDIVDKILLK